MGLDRDGLLVAMLNFRGLLLQLLNTLSIQLNHTSGCSKLRG